MALSPDKKKVISGGEDIGTVRRLWDIDTCKVIAKWMGRQNLSVCWSQNGRRVLSGSIDGTARQWDVKKGDTILKPIETGHAYVWAVIYSPDMNMIVTGELNGPWSTGPIESSIKIRNTNTGKLVGLVTLKGDVGEVHCLAWTNDGKTLISVLDGTSFVYAIGISPNDRILAGAWSDNTVRLWNLDNGRPIGSLLPAEQVNCVSFSADGNLENGQPIRSSLQCAADQVTVLCVSFSEDGKRLAISCCENAYTWDVAAMVREAGLDDLLSDSKLCQVKKSQSALRHRQAARFLVVYFTAASLIPMIRHCPLLWTGLKNF